MRPTVEKEAKGVTEVRSQLGHADRKEASSPESFVLATEGISVHEAEVFLGMTVQVNEADASAEQFLCCEYHRVEGNIW
jgi:hypothetical protein